MSGGAVERDRRRPPEGRVHHRLAFRDTRTATSNLNFQAGQNIPNTVIVKVGTGGRIQLYNGSAGTVQRLVDVTGYTVLPNGFKIVGYLLS